MKNNPIKVTQVLVKKVFSDAIKNCVMAETMVAKGKLVLLRTSITPNHGDLSYDARYNNYYLSPNNLLGQLVKPVIVSETERIEVGDKAIHTNPDYAKDWEIIECTENNRVSIQEHWNKVLALPEHFTPKQLQAIVDGDMKDGERLYIVCDLKYSGWEEDFDSKLDKDDRVVCLDQGNHITIHKAKQELMYTKDDLYKVAELIGKSCAEAKNYSAHYMKKEVDEWIQNNKS
jgi:hypothetical protein